MTTNFNFSEIYTSVSGSVFFYFGGTDVTIFRIFTGASNDFISVVASSDASSNDGKLYFSTTSSFYVIDLSNKSLYDMYTSTISGSTGETLLTEDIVDINVY